MVFRTIILAAGSSSRMGKIKQLLPFNETNLLGNAIALAKEVCPLPPLVVLGANASAIKAQIAKQEADFIENRNWEAGMGTSLAFGIEYLLQEPEEIDGVLILVPDQPMLTISHLKKLIKSYRKHGKQILATQYPDSIGVPVFIGQKYFDLLQKLRADYGARKIIKENSSDTEIIKADFDLLDIDTPEDYQNLIRNIAR